MRNILVTGANRGLGLALADALAKAGASIYCTGRSLKQLDGALNEVGVTPAKCWEVDFSRRESVLRFLGDLRHVEIQSCVHVASPFEGRLREASIQDLEGWTAFHLAANLIAKFAIDNFASDGRLIFVGSVAGTPGRISEKHTLYSVYKGMLRLLAEAVSKEGGCASYVNLGSFRDGGDGKAFLPTQKVVGVICDLIENTDNSEVQIDLMTPQEAARYAEPNRLERNCQQDAVANE